MCIYMCAPPRRGAYVNIINTMTCMCNVQMFVRYQKEQNKSNGEPNYGWDKSGVDFEAWPPRTDAEVRDTQQEYLTCRTATAQARYVKANCVRFSILTRLPYFDMVQDVVLDPMHNLWLVRMQCSTYMHCAGVCSLHQSYSSKCSP